MSLVAGSYERFIWGYRLKSADSLALVPLFSFPSHLSTIKTVAVYGTAAASGGNDDTIKIYDLSSSTEIGSLHLTASVTALSFFSPPSLSSVPRNLLAGNADGSLSIYDADPFVHLKTVKVHKKAVNSLSVHPSGKLALTVGHDECLAMVNLVRGRRSFFSKLGREASILQFDESGERFFMAVEDKISVHESEDAKLTHELENRKRVHCIAPAANGIVFAGGEDGSITAWDTSCGKVAFSIEEAHAARIKGIVVLHRKRDDPSSYIIASASSDGVIRVWDGRMVKKPAAEANTRSRLTCLAGSSTKRE
ncbi:hypothetical protein M569_04298 [Genlisea aurea]|uniref:Uncharacterized protein n=1 Tax=Genlisea aurea TaxID=192259 RepID=S8CT71_9LAMI|nr:hypothetical protein M569_04298 [Genlisea aurea]